MAGSERGTGLGGTVAEVREVYAVADGEASLLRRFGLWRVTELTMSLNGRSVPGVENNRLKVSILPRLGTRTQVVYGKNPVLERFVLDCFMTTILRMMGWEVKTYTTDSRSHTFVAERMKEWKRRTYTEIRILKDRLILVPPVKDGKPHIEIKLPPQCQFLYTTSEDTEGIHDVVLECHHPRPGNELRITRIGETLCWLTGISFDVGGIRLPAYGAWAADIMGRAPKPRTNPIATLPVEEAEEDPSTLPEATEEPFPQATSLRLPPVIDEF